MLKSNELALGSSPQLTATIARLKNGGAGGRGGRGGAGNPAGDGAPAASAPSGGVVGGVDLNTLVSQLLDRMTRLDQHISELNAEVKKLEDKVNAPKQ